MEKIFKEFCKGLATIVGPAKKKSFSGASKMSVLSEKTVWKVYSKYN